MFGSILAWPNRSGFLCRMGQHPFALVWQRSTLVETAFSRMVVASICL